MATEVSGIEIGVDTLRIEGDPTQLYEALAKAQGEFPDIPQFGDGQIGARKFKFAKYATIVKCVRPALTKHGIAILQPLHSRSEPVTTTIIAGHGASIISSFSFPPQKDPQEFGKQHTYYRRYQLQAILGLEGDKDADESDIPVQNQGFSEQAPEPKKEAKASSPKANGASAAKSDVTASSSKTNGSAQPSAATTEAKVEAKPTEEKPEPKVEVKKAVTSAKEMVDSIAPEKLNAHLTGVMKQFNPPWKFLQIRQFYAEHIDQNVELPTADAMEPEMKRQILTKIVEVHKVAPF